MHLPEPSPNGDLRKNAFDQGYQDALRGHTACPFGVPAWVEEWMRGYDQALEQQGAKLPRFSKLKHKARK